MGEHTNLQPREVLASRGLRIPQALLRRLRECGIHCQPALAKTGRVILSGYESGGGVHDLGVYCGYCSPDGRLLTWTHNLESALSRNGMHAIIVAADLVRIEVLRAADHLEILITRHTVRFAGRSPSNDILLRSRGMFREAATARKSEELTLSDIAFRDQTGSPVEIPDAFRSAALRVVQGALCVGCRHSHSLLKPDQTSDVTPRPTIEGILADPSTSGWMKNELSGALCRDPVDAANDAELLHSLLQARCDNILTSRQPCVTDATT